MSKLSQLQTVLRVETEREQSAQKLFAVAQQQHQAQRQKLQQLQQYRLDYFEQIKRAGGNGLDATRYQQHLSFIGKLDLACEQQLHVISRAKMLVDQKKNEWLKKRQRKDAILKLIESHQKQLQHKQLRYEQAMMDEFSTQQFLRKRHTG